LASSRGMPLAYRYAQACALRVFSSGSPIMPEPFSLTGSRCASPGSSLREEILGRTGSDAATSGILRSIDRFGGDPSILRYEISPKAHHRLHRSSTAVSWTVRAVRS
jgi:hypothetical protein